MHHKILLSTKIVSNSMLSFTGEVFPTAKLLNLLNLYHGKIIALWESTESSNVRDGS